MVQLQQTIMHLKPAQKCPLWHHPSQKQLENQWSPKISTFLIQTLKRKVPDFNTAQWIKSVKMSQDRSKSARWCRCLGLDAGSFLINRFPTVMCYKTTWTQCTSLTTRNVRIKRMRQRPNANTSISVKHKMTCVRQKSNFTTTNFVRSTLVTTKSNQWIKSSKRWAILKGNSMKNRTISPLSAVNC